MKAEIMKVGMMKTKILKASTSFLFALLAMLALVACKPTIRVDTEQGSISSDNDGSLSIRSDGSPPAKITATGQLFIDGKAVNLSPAQHTLVSNYYKELDGIAKEGAAIGKQGAAVAGKAMGEAVKGILSGNPDDIGAKIDAEAKKLEQQAYQICDRLKGLRAAQDALRAQVPAFEPYADLSEGDASDCKDKDGQQAQDTSTAAPPPN